MIKSNPDQITNDLSVIAKCDAILLAVPSLDHGQYFEAFEPYVKPDTFSVLGVFPNMFDSPTNLGISLRNPGAVTTLSNVWLLVP